MISNFLRRCKKSTRNFCITSAQSIQILSLTHLLSYHFLLDNLIGNGRYIFIYMYTLSDQRSWAISDFALIVNERYSLAAYRSKASKQARLVKRKVCFVSDASNCRGVQTSVQRLTPPTLQPPTPHNWHPVR